MVSLVMTYNILILNNILALYNNLLYTAFKARPAEKQKSELNQKRQQNRH